MAISGMRSRKTRNCTSNWWLRRRKSSGWVSRQGKLSVCAPCWISRTNWRFKPWRRRSSPPAPGENSNAIFIDKGSDSGLTADLAVITPEGVVGKILAIFPHSAQVLLITDPSSGVGVTLAQSRVQGILKGGSNSFCDLHYVMNEEVVTRGEAVVTSGLDQVYPKGLPVGTVVNVGDGNIYKTINVKPSVDLNRLEMVLVVLKPAAAEQQALTLPLRQ